MANIQLRLSGGTANVNAGASLGGPMSTSQNGIISSAQLNNLFDNISKAENFAGTTDYRCFYVHNDTVTVGQIYASGEVYLGNTPLAIFEFGVGDVNTVAPSIVTESVIPVGVTFFTTSAASPLAFSATLDPGDFVPVWVRRTADNILGAGSVTDTFTIVVKGVE